MRPRNSAPLKLTMGIVVFFCALFVLQAAFPDQGHAARKFKQKECADCHSDFNDKYGGMKNQHPGVKDGNCQVCHLSHGIVGKLLLVEEGNKLCFRCHEKTK